MAGVRGYAAPGWMGLPHLTRKMLMRMKLLARSVVEAPTHYLSRNSEIDSRDISQWSLLWRVKY
jgi:hypothetical protein